MFKFLEEQNKKIEKEFMSLVSKTIIARVKAVSGIGLISLSEYESMKMNSYEQKYTEPFLSSKALIWKIENALKNVSVSFGEYNVPTTYDEYLESDGIKELLKRYKKLVENTKLNI